MRKISSDTMNAITDRVIKSSVDFNAGLASKMFMDLVKKYARVYHMDRIYHSGTNAVHCDLGSGGYTVWFEDDLGSVATEVSISGEGAREIDKVWDENFDGNIYLNKQEAEEAFKKFFDALGDAEYEARQRFDAENPDLAEKLDY